jgi:hypothetical protein
LRVAKVGEILGRDGLIDEIAATAADDQPSPQLIIGDTGSGKTSVLLRLAQHLAEKGKMPIVVSLKGVDGLDFVKLANERFADYVDTYLRSEADADKVWRWVRYRREVVLLADDLDRSAARSPSDPLYTSARTALEAAARRGLPLVVTSRPAGLPRGGSFDVKEVGALEQEPEEAAARLWEQLHPSDSKAAHAPSSKERRKRSERWRIEQTVERGKLTENPFYFWVLRELVRLHALTLPSPSQADEHAVRLALMESWTGAISRGDGLALDVNLVSDFAAARLPPDAPPIESRFVEGRWLEAVHAAEQVGVTELNEDGQYQFRHDTLHAYFASRSLCKYGFLSKLLRDKPARNASERPREATGPAREAALDSPRTQLALIFAAARTRDPKFSALTCRTLIAFHPELAADRRLLRAAAAAELATAGGFHDLDDEIADACMEARERASPTVRRSVLEPLAKLSGGPAITALWRFAGDADYAVRWSAAEALARRCSRDPDSYALACDADFVTGADAYQHLSNNHFNRHLREGQEVAERVEKEGCAASLHDRTDTIFALKHMAWILPRLRTRMRSLGDNELSALVTRHLETLVELEEASVTSEKGLEASLAQGFKADAYAHARDGVGGSAVLPAMLAPAGAKSTDDSSRTEYANERLADPEERLRYAKERRKEALEQLERAGFWYSQLNLVHTIALWETYIDPSRRPGPTTSLLDRDKCHPFVWVAAELCDTGIHEAAKRREPDLIRRYVWRDESEVVARRPNNQLEPEAVQLVGDIVLLLNMNERGTEGQRQRFAEQNHLPHCMGASHLRKELFEDCAPQCDFELCPYDPLSGQPSAHREISRAFCAHQRRNARWRTARRWKSDIADDGLSGLWLKLESRAKV